MKRYNWQQSDWPLFEYDVSGIHRTLETIAKKMGYIQGKLQHFSDDLKTETIINILVEESVKTSEIEGEFISHLDIRSSIKNQLGLNVIPHAVHDKRAQGIAQLVLDVRQHYQEALTQEKLFDWHLMLFASSTNTNMSVGYWRVSEDPMQVISGYPHRPVVHFEAPPAHQIPQEMARFIDWFNDTAPEGVAEIPFAVVRAAIVHLYFESIHPFDDGNGRIGRILSEKALSQGFGFPVILSLSSVIESNKKAYYAALKESSKNNQITDWITYFVNLILEAQMLVEQKITFILKKSNFFNQFEKLINDRQKKVLLRMFKEGIKGFEGGMTAKKYMSITKTSKATATRDLQQLEALNIFKAHGRGRSVRYELQL